MNSQAVRKKSRRTTNTAADTHKKTKMMLTKQEMEAALQLIQLGSDSPLRKAASMERKVKQEEEESRDDGVHCYSSPSHPIDKLLHRRQEQKSCAQSRRKFQSVDRTQIPAMKAAAKEEEETNSDTSYITNPSTSTSTSTSSSGMENIIAAQQMIQLSENASDIDDENGDMEEQAKETSSVSILKEGVLLKELKEALHRRRKRKFRSLVDIYSATKPGPSIY